ncbi:Hpt domain-containing protein [Sphingomonas jatrophae]|uniref:Chemotaxis protein CheA n=1 Tax=Sphingomonas jatrophae TaxID=1166337 RepID=A0A1I6L0X6_9SPHN|nr:Hpt domain-containing protein [Sphingomonas jatrophae]SFR97143.1 two-component system, chemotaxis family, sensor kinase CheA [Sphingomonas jatrophae]
MDELMGDFIAETRETMEAIAGEIVAWEADPADRARLDAIFRFVHTVKGSCGFLNLTRLGRLAHAAEDALADVRDGRRPADAALVTAVLGIVDRIGALVDAIDRGEGLPDAEDHRLVAALDRRAPAPAPVAAPPPAARAPARSIRVSVDLLDRMMAGVSDLVLARNELARRFRDEDEAALERLTCTIGELREMITRTRMARVDSLFAALPRLVRDLSAELGRQVTLSIDGGEVELDREMIEMIRDPLTHIVRNAIDHGIEPAAERIARGKPAAGTLALAARQSGNQILIEVSDDGAGIDTARLVAKAVAAGLVDAGEAARLTPACAAGLIFRPGLSTAEAVTEVSGRGVGMDVVRANVERIGGSVALDNRPGEGVRLTLRMPMTLTIIPALTVSAGGQCFALPRSAIEEIVRADGPAVSVEQVGGATIATVRGVRQAVVDLAGLLALEAGPAPLLVLVRPAGGARFALAVATVLDHEDLVVKPAAPAVMATGLYAGVTLPDDNRPMLLLDPPGLAIAAGIATVDLAGPAADPAPEPVATMPALLFVALDGAERAVPLPLVERIEDVAADAVRTIRGRLRLAHGGRVIPLVADAALPGEGSLRVLHLSDGTAHLALAVAHVADIVALPLPCGDGIAVLDGRPVELVDVPALIAAAALPPPQQRPLVLLADAGDGWMEMMLRPMLEAAGYCLAPPGASPGDADVVIAAEGQLQQAAPGALVRLRAANEATEGHEDSVWRYDGAGLLAALAARTGGR